MIRFNGKLYIFQLLLFSLILFLLILNYGCGKNNTSDKEDKPATAGWTKPVQITTGSGFNTFNVAMDKGGSALVVYSMYDEAAGFDRIYAAEYLPQSGWGNDVVIDGDADSGDAYRPVVAFNPVGDGISVFTKGDGSNDRVYARWYRKGIDWEGSVTAIDGDGNGNSGEPQIAFDSSGNAVVVFTKANGIWATQFDSTSLTWDFPILLSSPLLGSVQSPMVIFLGSGKFLVTFYQEATIGSFRLYATIFDGLSWYQSPLQIDNDFHNFPDAVLAADGFGNAMVVFSEGTENKLIAKRYFSEWKDPEEIGVSTGKAIDIVYDSNHDVTVLFVQKENSVDRVFAKKYVNSTSTWMSAVTIDGGGGGNTDNPGIVFDSSNNGIAVFSKEVEGIPRIFAVHYDTIKGWGDPLIIDGDATSSASIPRIVIDWNDQAMVLFARPDPGSGQIYSVQYR